MRIKYERDRDKKIYEVREVDKHTQKIHNLNTMYTKLTQTYIDKIT